MTSHLETDSSVGMADQQQKQQQQQKQKHDKLKEEQQEPHVDDLGCVRDIELTEDHTLVGSCVPAAIAYAFAALLMHAPTKHFKHTLTYYA